MTRGVTKKVFAQIRAFENLGFHVKYYTGYVDEGAAVFNDQNEVVYCLPYGSSHPGIRRVRRNQLLKKAAAKFLEQQKEEFRLCYARHLFFDHNYLRFLKAAKKYCKNIWIEAHSYPIYNKYWVMYYPVYFLDMLYSRNINQYADLIVAIADGYQKIWGTRAICISNGVDLSNIGPQQKTPGVDGEVRMVAVSYEWLAHGYDRIIDGLAEYYSKNPEARTGRKVTLTLVGTVLSSTQKRIKKLGMERYVCLAGVRSGEELDAIYNKSDIAIGALGGHRANLVMKCELKTREYMAKGIPYVYAGAAKSEEESAYCLRIPSDDSPLPVDAVLEFYDRLQATDDYPLKIRKLSETCSWEAQYRDLFGRLAKEEGKGG